MRHTLTFRRLPTRSASLRTPTSSSSYSLCTFSLFPLSASLPLSSSAVIVPALLSYSSSSTAASPSPSPFVILLLAQVLVVWPLLGSLPAAVAGQLQGALQRLQGLGESTHTSCTGLRGFEKDRGESERRGCEAGRHHMPGSEDHLIILLCAFKDVFALNKAVAILWLYFLFFSRLQRYHSGNTAPHIACAEYKRQIKPQNKWEKENGRGVFSQVMILSKCTERPDT